MVIGVFYGISFLATTGRVIIRLWLYKRLRLDDYLLFLASFFLTGATGILYYGIPTIYFGAKLTFDPAAVLGAGINETEILHLANMITTISWTYLALSWVAIFLVKYGFLSLFKRLVDRIPPMYRFWKGVLVFTSLVFALSVCDGFMACPNKGTEAGKEQDIAH